MEGINWNMLARATLYSVECHWEVLCHLELAFSGMWHAQCLTLTQPQCLSFTEAQRLGTAKHDVLALQKHDVLGSQGQNVLFYKTTMS